MPIARQAKVPQEVQSELEIHVERAAEDLAEISADELQVCYNVCQYSIPPLVIFGGRRSLTLPMEQQTLRCLAVAQELGLAVGFLDEHAEERPLDRLMCMIQLPRFLEALVSLGAVVVAQPWEVRVIVKVL